MLDIFFTNKIPSTEAAWRYELILVASLLEEFDGLVYDREAVIDRFATISNRIPEARDPADFCDQYGAYISYLGLMYFEQSNNQWICRMNPRAKELLCGELPDPQAFIRLQMSLFQYPNPIGATYRDRGGLSIEPLSLAKRVYQINSGIKTVPFRLFLRVLLALHDQFGLPQAYLTHREIWYCLFTNPRAINTPEPNGDSLAQEVYDFRRAGINGIRAARDIPNLDRNTLRNLHILNHTALIFQPEPGRIDLVPEAGIRETQLGDIAYTIASMTTFYPAPEPPCDLADIREWTYDQIVSGLWRNYYCGDEIPTATSRKSIRAICRD